MAVVFSAGGACGISYIGGIEYFESHGMLSEIYKYSGCSIGSIIAYLLTIGYNSKELKDITYIIESKKIVKYGLDRFIDSYGFCDGKFIVKLLKLLTKEKVYMNDITFYQHYAITGKELWINSSCIEDDKAEYFSYITSPHMSIIQAIRMSISIPFIFTPVKYNGKTYIDGGFHDQSPYFMFSQEKIIYIFRARRPEYNYECESWETYIKSLIMSIYNRILPKYPDDRSKYKVISIYTPFNPLNLKISKKVKKILIKMGYTQTEKFISRQLNMSII